jgi:hypothetical protein
VLDRTTGDKLRTSRKGLSLGAIELAGLARLAKRFIPSTTICYNGFEAAKFVALKPSQTNCNFTSTIFKE